MLLKSAVLGAAAVLLAGLAPAVAQSATTEMRPHHPHYDNAPQDRHGAVETAPPIVRASASDPYRRPHHATY